MTKRTMQATMLYMSALAVTAASARGNPQKIQGHMMHTRTIEPETFDPTDLKAQKAAEDAFDAAIETAVDAGWHFTVGEALDAEQVAPVDETQDAEAIEAMKAAIEENEKLKAELADAIKASKIDAKNIEKISKERDKLKAELEAATKPAPKDA